MESEQAIKISLCHSVAVKAVEILFDVLSSIGEKGIVSYLAYETEQASNLLDGISGEIREHIEPLFDAEDEQAIEDIVCGIEETLNQTPTPVPVHPEISNILNKHLGEK